MLQYTDEPCCLKLFGSQLLKNCAVLLEPDWVGYDSVDNVLCKLAHIRGILRFGLTWGQIDEIYSPVFHLLHTGIHLRGI